MCDVAFCVLPVAFFFLAFLNETYIRSHIFKPGYTKSESIKNERNDQNRTEQQQKTRKNNVNAEYKIQSVCEMEHWHSIQRHINTNTNDDDDSLKFNSHQNCYTHFMYTETIIYIRIVFEAHNFYIFWHKTEWLALTK